ncbi:MAG: hypothetical protein QQW96_02305 [Tychonema bourrellyi B0820]|nr:hypothetical protein [Tychonema bourrellyi B0820]
MRNGRHNRRPGQGSKFVHTWNWLVEHSTVFDVVRSAEVPTGRGRWGDGEMGRWGDGERGREGERERGNFYFFLLPSSF